MNICAAGQPRHWGRLRPNGTGAEGHLHSGPIPGPRRENTGEGINPSSREIGGPRSSRPNKNGP